MKIRGVRRVEVEVTDNDLANALLQKVVHMLGDIDIAGCDLYTSGIRVYVGKNWHVASNPNIATLVDAANILLYGKRLTLD